MNVTDYNVFLEIAKYFEKDVYIYIMVIIPQAHLFDLKADQEIMVLSKQSILFGASSLDFSKSGK